MIEPTHAEFLLTAAAAVPIFWLLAWADRVPRSNLKVQSWKLKVESSNPARR